MVFPGLLLCIKLSLALLVLIPPSSAFGFCLVLPLPCGSGACREHRAEKALGRTGRILQGKVVHGQRGIACDCVRKKWAFSVVLLNMLLTSDGLGYSFCLDFPESVGSKLDRVFPFSLLKRIPGLKYIPGSSAERKAFESSK